MKLLLLHPLPLDGSIFSDDLRALADDCAAPTLYRCGANIGAWAQAALDSIGDGPAVVVGNSIGGSCAVEVARLAPTKVKALVLVGAKPGHRLDPAQRDEALLVIETGGIRAAWERYWRPLFGPTATAETIERGWQVASSQGAEAIADGVRAFHGRPDRARFLGSWPGPILLVSGEHDINYERTRLLAESIPNAAFRPVGGAGHYVPLEAPHALTAITAEALTHADRRRRC